MDKKEQIIDNIIEELSEEKSPDLSRVMSDNELLSIVDLVLLLKKEKGFDISFKANLESTLARELNNNKAKSSTSYRKIAFGIVSAILIFFGFSSRVYAPLKMSSVKYLEENIDTVMIKAYNYHTLNSESFLYNYDIAGFWFTRFIHSLQ